MDVCPHWYFTPSLSKLYLFQPLSEVFQNKYFKESYAKVLSLLTSSSKPACSTKFITHHAKQASSRVHLFLMLSYFMAGQIPLILVTVISRTNVDESRPWMILSIMVVSYHFELFSESTDGSLSAWNQLFQVLVPQLLPGSALSCTLTTSFELCLQVYFCWFTTSLAWLLYFASNHLEMKSTLEMMFCKGKTETMSLCLQLAQDDQSTL